MHVMFNHGPHALRLFRKGHYPRRHRALAADGPDARRSAGGAGLGGATDDLGFKAGRDIYRMRDVHAPVLHLMGVDNMRLTYYYAARNMRLTDTGGEGGFPGFGGTTEGGVGAPRGSPR